MKKINISLAILSLFFASCVNESDSFNDNRKAAYSVNGEFLFANAEKELVDQLTTPSVNLNVFRYFTQYWAATQYRTESRYNVTNRKIPDNHWSALYTEVLQNLKTAKIALENETKPDAISQTDWDNQLKNKLAIIEILNVYTFQVLIDTFGDIPYSDALDIDNNVLPVYEDDAVLYPLLIVRLNNAIAQLDKNYSSISESNDVIYGGDVAKWKLFANSLKAKLGINLADVDGILSKKTVEEAFTSGVILTNDNNAVMAYNSFAPNYNPIFDNLVASNRNDFVPTSIFVDSLNKFNDPRRSIYFTAKTDGSYVGGKYGFTNTAPYATSYSHIGDVIKQSNSLGVLIDAAEMNFIMAEAAARNYSVVNTADVYYNAAINASMKYWGIDATSISTYISQPSIAYTTASGDWKQKIATQAWIAMYNRGFESWTFWRRLDFPALSAPTSAYPVANGKIPVRLTYPIIESTVNGVNYKKAQIAIGDDLLNTHIFWDKY